MTRSPQEEYLYLFKLPQQAIRLPFGIEPFQASHPLQLTKDGKIEVRILEDSASAFATL